MNHDGQGVTQNLQFVADRIDGGHLTLIVSIDERQQVLPIDPDRRVHPGYALRSSTCTLRVDRSTRVGKLYGAAKVVLYGFHFALDTGLVAPHCMRLLLGADHRRVLPAAALLGGVFLVAADLVGRLVSQPLELPLSVVTALAGVPFFLVLLRRSTRAPTVREGR